jgi:hypothetical protein
MEALITILAIMAILAMFLYFKKRIGKPVTIGKGTTQKEKDSKWFQFLTMDDYGETPLNKWYRLSKWESSNMLRMDSTWSSDWKLFSKSEQPVVGVTHGDREDNFLKMGDQEDFKIFLERERQNKSDPNAIKVMGFATVNGQPMTKQLGYLSKETAKSLKDEVDLDARPRIVDLPYEDREYGLKIQVLVRSARYKKKLKKR